MLAKGADTVRAEVHGNFLAVNDKSLLLDVSSPNALGAALRIADIIAVLVTFTGEFTLCCHKFLVLQVYILLFFGSEVNTLVAGSCYTCIDYGKHQPSIFVCRSCLGSAIDDLT